MIAFVLRRIALTVPLLVLLSAVTFTVLSLAPGDAAQAILAGSGAGQGARTADLETLREQLGLNQPFWRQYLNWLGDLGSFDFGVSYRSGREVREILRATVPATALLTGAALSLQVVLGLASGALAGLFPRSLFARALGLMSIGLYAMPTFLVAMLAILLFGVRLDVFPVSGMTATGQDVSVRQVATHLVLPGLTLAFGHHFAQLAAVTAASVSASRRAPFLEYAEARGIPRRRILWRHIVRPALIPSVALIGTSLGTIMAGAVAVEEIFAWPGAGREMLRAANARDYPVLMSFVLLTGLTLAIANIVVDAINAALDPRFRLVRSHGGRVPDEC